jgi:hypothetical protein
VLPLPRRVRHAVPGKALVLPLPRRVRHAQYGALYPGSAAHMIVSSVVSSAKPLGGVGGVFGRTDRQLELHLSIVDDPMLTGVVR